MSTLPVAVRVVLPSATIVMESGSAPNADRVRDLERGRPVALVDRRIGSRHRLRKEAAHLGLQERAEYLVLPSWSRAAFVVEDDRDAVAWLLRNLATVPPGLARGGRLVDLVIDLAGAVSLFRVLGRLTPCHVLIGVRR